MKMKFQWFFDFHTSADSMTLLSVSAGGRDVKKRLAPMFQAYKYFRLGSVKMTIRAATSLPVDPTHLSYESGENVVDPRDQMNVGLTRITNGEDIFEDISALTPEQHRGIYYSMMMDPRWYKFPLQGGCTRKAYPRFWMVGQAHQDYFPGTSQNIPMSYSVDGVTSYGTENTKLCGTNAKGTYVPGTGQGQMRCNYAEAYSDSRGFFQTGMKGRVGWLPTDSYQFMNDGTMQPLDNAVPEIGLYHVLLPPAYKTEYFFRAYVTEEVFFKGPVVNNYNGDPESDNCYRSLDRFILPTRGIPMVPTQGIAYADGPMIVDNDGSKYEERLS